MNAKDIMCVDAINVDLILENGNKFERKLIMIKSMKLSDYFEVRKAKYTYIQVIPSKSCRNTSTDKILVLANTMYKKLDKLIKIENKKLIIESKLKLSYYIAINI